MFCAGLSKTACDVHNILLNVIRNIMRYAGSNICERGATEICAKCYGVAL